jgi:hypothetical protein
VRARLEKGLQLLEELVALIPKGEMPIRVEDYVENLRFVHRVLSEQQPRLEKELVRVSNLLKGIETGSFDTRVRRWIGTWEWREQVPDENGELTYPGEIEIRKLAKAAAAQANAVPEETLSWLTTTEAKRAPGFFLLLGRYDESSLWEERINHLGECKNGELAFASYYGGRAQDNAGTVEEKLDELMKSQRVRSEALLGATSYVPGSARAVNRIVVLLQRGIDPVLAERRLMAGGWMKPLEISEATALLKAIAGPLLENSDAVIDFLAMWVHTRKPLEGELAELAWQALESPPSRAQAWDSDVVAAELAAGNPDRAFALLERLLTLPSDLKSWEPLDRHSGSQFWNTLWALNRQRVLELLFQLGASSPVVALRIRWQVPEILNLQQDRQFLEKFARQNERNGEFVSSVITSSQGGFWEVALNLLSLYGESKKVRSNIASAIYHPSHMIVGPMSEHYNRRAEMVESVRDSRDMPNSTRVFLTELAAYLKKDAEREQRDEENESVNW